MRLAVNFSIAMVVLGLVGSVIAQPQPDTLYNAINPSGLTGQLCHNTAPPLVLNPTNVFLSYHCFNPDVARIAHLNLISNVLTVKLESNDAQVIFRDQPVAVSTREALVWATGPSAFVSSLSATRDGPQWSKSRYGSPSGCVTWRNQAFLPMGPHIVNGMNVTSLMAVDLGSGNVTWEKTFLSLATVGTPIVYEDRVIFTVGSSLFSLNVTAGPNGDMYQMYGPCNMVLAAGQEFHLRLVEYGSDFNGPLNALILYAQTSDPSNPNIPNFTTCRLHHSLWAFGQSEWIASRGDSYSVQAVTGGGGAIFFSFYNTVSGKYSVGVYNATPVGRAFLTEVFRSSADKYSYPQVMTSDSSLYPQVVMSVNGVFTAYSLNQGNLITNYATTFQCAQSPAIVAVGSTSRAYCVSRGNGDAVSLNFNGTLIWHYPGLTTMYPAMPYRDSAVFFVPQTGVVGVSVSASATLPPVPVPSSGTNAGIVVLIIFIIIFVLLLGFAVWKAVSKRQGARRTATKAQLDSEGYAGLNA